jgi:PPOX class probable FMN-dependent enzyme
MTYGGDVEFDQAITTIEELRQIIAPPRDFISAKDVSELDEYCRDFIARSPFVLIGSSDGEGAIDVSPKGDPPGFVRVLDERTLAIPDRPGNRRIETFTNVLRHPYVGLIFLIPGVKNTLRVRGGATIVRDAGLRESMSVNGRVPELALVVSVTTAFFHCAKCIIRSELWSAGSADVRSGDDDTLYARAIVKADQLSMSVDRMQELILRNETEKLY